MEVTALEAARSSTYPLSLDWKTILGIKSYDQKRLASLSPKTRTFGRSRVSFLLAGPPDLWADPLVPLKIAFTLDIVVYTG